MGAPQEQVNRPQRRHPIIVDIYCRVSTDPQEDNTSLDEQEAECRAYCQEHGLIVGIVHREVFSGFLYREREGLSLLRQRYRDGKIHGIVIRTLDRLSRNQTHTAVLIDEMDYYGVTLYGVKEKIDNTPMGKFVIAALALVAEMEREKIMDRSTMGRVSKAKAGKIVSGSKAPYGRNWLYGEVPGPGGRKELVKQVVLHDGEACVLRWLAEQYAAGVGANNLMCQLNDPRLPAAGTPAYELFRQLGGALPWPPPPPEGRQWSTVTILRLICDQRITGKGAKIFAYQQRKTKQPLEPIDLPDGTYPAIMSEELYQQVMARREANRAEAVRASREPEEYLLRAGFVKCGFCSSPMMAVKHRKHHTYRCITPEGHTNTILSNPLDAAIWQWLQQLADHIDLIEEAVALTTSSTKLEHDTEAIRHANGTHTRLS